MSIRKAAPPAPDVNLKSDFVEPQAPPINTDNIERPEALSVQEALGLDESPADSMTAAIDRARDGNEVTFNANVPAKTKREDSFKTRKQLEEQKAADEAAGTEPTKPAKEAPGQEEDVMPDLEDSADEKAEQEAAEAPTEKAKVSKPAAKPAEPVDPVEETPERPTSVKIGDKEFSQEDLEKLVNFAAQQKQKLEEAAPTPEEPKVETAPPTPEEIAAEQAAHEQKEQEFISATLENLSFPKVSSQALEAILDGGEEAVTALNSLLGEQAARTILETRKGIYKEMNQYLEKLESRLHPVFSQQQDLQRVTVENAFLSKHAEYGTNPNAMAVARQIAEQLTTKYPDQVNKMSMDDFVNEVDRQSSEYLNQEMKRWMPDFQGSWKDLQTSQAAPAAPAAPAAEEEQSPPGTPAKMEAPAAPAPKARPKPPASNAPQKAGFVGEASSTSWQLSTARGLADI